MELIVKILPALIEGTKMTLLVFLLTLITSLPLGILIGFASAKGPKLLKSLIGVYIWIIRGTPLLLQLIFVFFGLPFMGIIIESRVIAVLIAFVINYSAYFAEIFRGGIQSIPNGQYEAAQVLGISKNQTTFKIILPQVFQIIFPSVSNEVITLVKDTSLIYALGLSDVMKAGRIAMQREASIVPLIVVGIIYLILTGVMTLLLNYIEQKRMKRGI
ncbi:amino acid ABC transporter permease [Vagococcus vulneris]|uniref:Amino acid ABC transporter permease n=1 Tax=Vagococcus vulneris TaxID=1977869 RepID=A0A430A2E2_9ENTE|nr:amino acid ABC transporter permease [Vagococcus vulneris]RSU00582.1 amino acid ABC transporter permease [Vagococcus vulneris]